MRGEYWITECEGLVPLVGEGHAGSMLSNNGEDVLGRNEIILSHE